PIYGDLRPAVVISVDKDSAQVQVKGRDIQTISWDEMKWARPFINDDRQGAAPKTASEIMAVGEMVWVREKEQPATEDNPEPASIWRLSQVPEANTAFIAMNPENGSVTSLVGGFNFVHSKFNRATQS
ncbi:penicillin-sensitive transpeptidase, partial [Vibrio campbellii]